MVISRFIATALAASLAVCANAQKFVEYIETNGSGNTPGEYIVLDYVPTSSSVVEADLVLKNTSNTHAIFCARGPGTGDRTFTLFYLGNSGFRWDYNRTDGQKTSVSPNTRVTVRCAPDGFWLNGTHVVTYSPVTYTPANKMTLFGSYTGATTATPVANDNFAAMRLYSFKVWDDNGATLRVDLYPYVDANGVAALYDAVTDTVYYNLKSGTAFSASPTEVAGPVSSGLVITAYPRKYGEPTPAYGTYTNLPASLPVSAPAVWSNAAETAAATCTGWKLYNELNAEVDAGATCAFTYVHPDADAYRRLAWQWDVEYRMGVFAQAGEGTAAVSAPWVAEGATATFTATPAAGYAFSCWMDGSAIVSRSNPYAAAADGPKTLRAVFTDASGSGWRYDGSGSTKTLTELDPPDGGPAWVLKCTVSGQALTLTGVQEVGTNAVLNLRLPIADANNVPYAIVKIGDNAFKERATIEEVRLPDTLARIGICAFRDCPALTKVTPLLPDSVTQVDYEAFYNSPVAGALRVGFGESFAFVKGYYGQATHFGNSAIVEFVAGPGLAEIPQSTFKGCTSLTNVDFTATMSLSYIGRGAFDGCTALTRVTPFLPVAVTQVGVEAFRNAPVEGTLRVGFGGSFTLLTDDRGWNGSEYFKNTKVGEIVFGPGVTNIRNNFALNSTALTNIVFQTTNLTTVGYGAFEGCSSLRRVSPLLPDTVTYLGSRAFLSTAVEGSVRLGFGGPVSLPADFYTQAQAFSGARVYEFLFGPGVSTVPAYFAPNCTALTNIVFQTTNLTSIGRDAFSGCSALRRVDPLLPDTVAYVGTMAFYNTVVEGTLRLGFCDGTVSLPAEHYNQSHAFTASKISEVVFGPGVTNVAAYFAERCTMLTNLVFQGSNTVAVGGAAFNGCSSLREITARPYVTWSSDSFNSTGQNLNGRILYPMTSREWNDYIDSLGGDFKTWADDATAAEKDLYESLFPDGPAPRGHAAVGGPKRWFVPYADFVAGAVNLSVMGEPYDLGVAAPDYTDLTTVTPPAVLSVSQYGERDGIAYEAFGYRVDTLVGDAFALGTPVCGTRSFTFNEDEADFYRVAWLWREAAYSVTAHSPPPCAATVSGTTLDDPSVTGTYYLSNTVATVTATPVPGATFVRWFGDVPEGRETSATLSLPVDSVKSVTPYAELPWTYDGNAKTVTDGYWTLNVTGSSDALTIASVKTAPADIWLLDLRKATDGCVFASLGTDAFKQKTYLQEVRLPDTITSIGRGAFDGCTSLRRVTPLLPEAVTQVGVEAFRNAPVEGTLRVGFGGPFTLLTDDRGWNGSEYFRNTQVGEIVFGPGVTNIRNKFAQDCKALTNVVFQTTDLARIGFWAFDSCTALRTVTPFLPDTVTFVGTRAFYNTAVEGTLRIGFGGPFTLGNDENGWNQGHHFANTKIGKMVFGPGVTDLKVYFASGCKALTEVIFQTTNLASIAQESFNGCTSLRRVEPLLPDTVTYIGAAAFNNTVVEGTLRLGFGRQPLRLGAEYYSQGRQFLGSRIEKFIAGHGVTNIPPLFAYDCKALSSVNLDGRNLERIESEAFRNDTALTDVRIRTFPAFGSNVFNGVPANARFFLAHEAEGWDDWLADSANATPWEDLASGAQDAYRAIWGVSARRPKGRAVKSNSPFPKDSWLLRYSASAPTMFIMR